MTHAWAKLRSVTGSASGCTANSTAPAPTNGTTCAVVVAVHSAAVRLKRRSSTSGRQCTDWSSGRPSAATAALGRPGSAARDRQAHDHEIGVDRELADLLGLALAGRDHAEVALLQLLAERAHGRFDRLGIVGRPLGERRVAGVVHADETGHAQPPGAGPDPQIVRPPGRRLRGLRPRADAALVPSRAPARDAEARP